MPFQGKFRENMFRGCLFHGVPQLVVAAGPPVCKVKSQQVEFPDQDEKQWFPFWDFWESVFSPIFFLRICCSSYLFLRNFCVANFSEKLYFHLFCGWVTRRSRSPQVFLPRRKDPHAVTSTLGTFQIAVVVSCSISVWGLYFKHCQRHNGPEGWVHLIIIISWVEITVHWVYWIK